MPSLCWAGTLVFLFNSLIARSLFGRCSSLLFSSLLMLTACLIISGLATLGVSWIDQLLGPSSSHRQASLRSGSNLCLVLYRLWVSEYNDIIYQCVWSGAGFLDSLWGWGWLCCRFLGRVLWFRAIAYWWTSWSKLLPSLYDLLLYISLRLSMSIRFSVSCLITRLWRRWGRNNIPWQIFYPLGLKQSYYLQF